MSAERTYVDPSAYRGLFGIENVALTLGSQRGLLKVTRQVISSSCTVRPRDGVVGTWSRQYGRETLTPGKTRKCLSLRVTNCAEEQKAAAPIKQSRYPMPLLSRKRRCQRSASCD